MKTKYNVAIVGSTGLVGMTVLKVLEERDFKNCTYTLFSSRKSAGSKLRFLGQNYIIQELTESSFDYGFDYAIFCAGGAVSEKFVPIAVSHDCVVIDNSSVFRMNTNVPLVVPEVNPEKIPYYIYVSKESGSEWESSIYEDGENYGYRVEESEKAYHLYQE